MKHTFLLLALVFSLVSCMNSFRITVQNPPLIQLPDSVNRITVINNVNAENSPEKATLGKQIQQALNGNVVAAEHCEGGIARGINESNRLQASAFPSISCHKLDKSIDWALLDSIAALQQSQVIVEIDHFVTDSPLGGTVVANATAQTRHPIYGSAFVHVYYPAKETFIEGFQMDGVYYMPISGNVNPLSMLMDMARKQQYFRALGFDIGYRIGTAFYSPWQWVGRQYYTRGSRQIRAARRLIRYGNWSMAEEMLLPETNNSKRKVAGRAKYNLALVYEGQGRLEEAIQMCNRSMVENGNRKAPLNGQILQDRLRMRSLFFLDK